MSFQSTEDAVFETHIEDYTGEVLGESGRITADSLSFKKEKQYTKISVFTLNTMWGRSTLQMEKLSTGM